jgi:hypothetical protein
VGMKVGADVRMELVIEVGIASSGKSWTMKGAGCSCWCCRIGAWLRVDSVWERGRPFVGFH